MIAVLLETGLQADGTVALLPVPAPSMGGLDRLSAAKSNAARQGRAPS